MLLDPAARLAHHEALADGHVAGVDGGHVVAPLGRRDGGLERAGGGGGVGQVQDLRRGVRGMDAVEGKLEVMRGAAAGLGQHAELTALLEHLGGRDGAIVDGLVAHGDVHGHELDSPFGGLGGGDVAAGLGGDDDLCHGFPQTTERHMYV